MNTLSAGVWSAIFNGDSTVYQSGNAVISGPVSLGARVTLNIASGATVSNMSAVTGGIINISSGGALLSSYINNGTLYLSSGGNTTSNIFDSTLTYVQSGGYSLSDTWNNAGGMGMDYSVVSNGGVVSNATIQSGGGLQFQSGASGNGVMLSSGGSLSMDGGTVNNFVVSNGAYATSSGITYSGISINGQPDINTAVVLTGTWNAVLSNGVTLYQSGSVSYQWPVALGAGATLNVMSGATASRISGTHQSTVNITNGGTLVSSYLNNGWLNVSAGGVSTSNVLDSTLTRVSAGGSSVSDTWNNAGGMGTDYSFVSSGGTVSNATIQSGGKLQFQSGASGNGVMLSSGGSLSMDGGTVNNFVVSNGGYATSSGITYSGISINGQPDINTAVVLTGTWNAVLSNGVTLYQSGSVSYQWPVALGGGATLNVMSGATASRISGTNQSTVNITNGGTLVSSYLNNGWLNVSAGGVSTSNVLDSTLTRVSAGGSSVSDTWNNAGGMGADYSFVSSGGMVSNATIQSGGGLQFQSGASGNGVMLSSGGSLSMDGGTVNNFVVSNGAYATSSGITYSGISINGQPDINTAVVLTGTWNAVLSNGVTLYQSGSVSYQWPVALGAGATLNVMSGATASRISGTNQSTVNITNGGTLVSSYLNNGWLNVSAGGVSTSNVLDSTLTRVSAGGSSVSDTWNNASGMGTDYSFVSSGGTVINPVIGSGGYLSGSLGATLSNVYVSSGGSFETQAPIGSSINIPGFPSVPAGASVMSGTWVATVQNGETVYQSGNTTLTDPVVLAAGGYLTIQSGAVVSYLSTGQGAQIVVASGALVSSYIDNGSVYVSAGGITSGNAFNSTWSITSSGGASIGDTWFASGANHVWETSYIQSGAIMSNGAVGPDAKMFVNNGGVAKDPSVAEGGTLVIQNQGADGCFLAGSLIRTVLGDVAVEDLQIGDELICFENGQEVKRPITWIGVSHNTFRPKQPLDMAGYPVRVQKDAFGDNQPSHDLLITAEHCFVFEGAFIPVRMLVNGSSIRYDTNISSYDYYHVELERHSVIMSNNVPTESYLNTGNKNFFQTSQNIVPLRENMHAWNTDSALPLCVSRSVVEPVYQALSARALQLGLSTSQISTPLSHDPALKLGLADGRIIHPMRQSDGMVIFVLPGRVSEVSLLSRTSRPCDVVGPFLDDRRSLGVLVGDITLFASKRTISLKEHLTCAPLEGWCAAENAVCRWTDGKARISLPAEIEETGAILSINVLQAGPYKLDEKSGSTEKETSMRAA